MSKINFPVDPEIDDIFTDPDLGKSWKWTGIVWSPIFTLGYTGSQGFTGSQGPIGYTGSRGSLGFTGSLGYTGSKGDTGFTGSRGDTGFTGSQGNIGFTGSRGFTGSQGDTGYTGSKGDIGFTGSQGDIGYTGSRGATGFTGSQGDLGYTGSKGDIGYTGSQGVTGFTGSQGTVTPAGANKEIQFNDGGSTIGANVLFTFDKATTLLNIGNSTVNTIANSLQITIANATNSANLTSSQLTIGTSVINTTAYASGANVVLDFDSLFIGNSTANLFSNSVFLRLANATGQANLQPTQLVIGTSTVNSTALAAGANVIIGTVKLSIGNTTANLLANSVLVKVSNSTGTANLQPTQLVIGSQVINSTSHYNNGNAALFNGISNNITTGFTFTTFDAGTKNTGTFTLDPTQGNNQKINANGAFTLAAPSTDCAIDLHITNGTSAGAITLSGFANGGGETYVTTSGKEFLFSMRRVNGDSLYVWYIIS